MKSSCLSSEIGAPISGASDGLVLVQNARLVQIEARPDRSERACPDSGVHYIFTYATRTLI